MGLALYIIIIIIPVVFIYYNRRKKRYCPILIFLLLSPSELIYRYFAYKSDFISSSGLTVEKSIKDVDGFVYEGLEEHCYTCVAPFLVRLGYEYVDIADNNNIGDIADAYFRFTLAEKGAKSYKDFARVTKYVTAAEIEKRFHIGPRQCIARETIAEHDTKFQLLKAVRKLPSGDRHEFHKARNRLTNERLAASNSYLFSGGFLGWFWFAPGEAPMRPVPTKACRWTRCPAII